MAIEISLLALACPSKEFCYSSEATKPGCSRLVLRGRPQGLDAGDASDVSTYITNKGE